MNNHSETKVGIFVIIAIAGLVWLTSQTGDFASSTGKNGSMRALTTEFDSVDGLNIGAKVKISGVPIGEVSDIYLNENGQATVNLSVKKGLPIPENVIAQVSSEGLIGQKFVALTTDFGAKGLLSEEVLKIPSKPAASVDDIAGNFAKISADLESVTAALRSSLGGAENAEKLQRIVNNVDGASAKLNRILGDEIEPGKINTIINNMASITTVINKDADSIISDLKAASKSLRTILGDNEEDAAEMIKNFGIMSKNLASITTRLENGEGTLGKLLSADDSTGNPIENFNLAMADLKEITAKINNGEGTLGRLINDPSTVEKVENALDSISAVTGRLEAFRTEVDFNGYALPAEGVSKGHFNITFRPSPKRYYVIGITGDGFNYAATDARADSSFYGEEFGDAIKYTAQFGHVWEAAMFGRDVGMRIGLKDSSFGLGIDYTVPVGGKLIELAADLYDFSGENSGSGAQNPHLDLTGKLNLIGRSFYAMGGYDNVFDDKYGSPFIGFGFRFEDDDLKYMIGQAL